MTNKMWPRLSLKRLANPLLYELISQVHCPAVQQQKSGKLSRVTA